MLTASASRAARRRASSPSMRCVCRVTVRLQPQRLSALLASRIPESGAQEKFPRCTQDNQLIEYLRKEADSRAEPVHFQADLPAASWLGGGSATAFAAESTSARSAAARWRGPGRVANTGVGCLRRGLSRHRPPPCQRSSHGTSSAYVQAFACGCAFGFPTPAVRSSGSCRGRMAAQVGCALSWKDVTGAGHLTTLFWRLYKIEGRIALVILLASVPALAQAVARRCANAIVLS